MPVPDRSACRRVEIYSRLAPACASGASLAAMPPALSAISPVQMCTRSSLKPMVNILVGRPKGRDQPGLYTGQQLEIKGTKGRALSTNRAEIVGGRGPRLLVRRSRIWPPTKLAIAANCYCGRTPVPGQYTGSPSAITICGNCEEPTF